MKRGSESSASHRQPPQICQGIPQENPRGKEEVSKLHLATSNSLANETRAHSRQYQASGRPPSGSSVDHF